MSGSNIRKPAAAGRFYPGSSHQLKNQIEGFIDKKTKRRDVIACMLPHAGYDYSGSLAAETVSRINIKDTLILLGPNHTGYGADFSIVTAGSWETPLGEVAIDWQFAQEILKCSKFLKDDPTAHAYEHSLEVELPLFQYFKPDIKIIPMVFLSDDISALKEIGQDIACAIKEAKLSSSVLIVASSDMTHYEPQKEAEAKDREAIKAILELNEDKLVEKITRLNISMCGYAPVIVMLAAVKKLGAAGAELVKYQTSGDVSGDTDAVVGYAGITIY